MADVTIEPAVGAFDARVRPPGSKSLTNRALVLAALASGTSRLSNILVADDTRVMVDALGVLGFKIELGDDSTSAQVHGRGGKIPAGSAELFCGNSGTTIRFLAAMCCLGRGEYVLDGAARMRERPMADMLALLRGLGVRCEAQGENGGAPIRIFADRLPGGLLQYGSEATSQFLSAILMAGPYARHEIDVELSGPQTSWPYVTMTMQLMDRFDVTPELVRDPASAQPRRIIIPLGQYRATDMAIEPDASGASYFLAAAAMHPGSTVTIEGLGRDSLQGDVGFADVLAKMGARVSMKADSISVQGTRELRGIDVDLLAMPDMAQTLAVVALYARGKTTIRGLHTLRVKETDRLSALSTQLTRLGADVRIEGDVLQINPPEEVRPAAIDTYDDHRMAMSFALAGTRTPGMVIKDAQCVSKTYPAFFDDLRKMMNGE